MSGELDRRVGALGEAAELARGRLPDAHVRRAEGVVARAGQRLGLGLDVTVVALAGPTGAGKSSLFNALAGAELVSAGRRRPTTAAATAAVWGDVGDALLDWLEVPRRHRVGGGPLSGLVVLDLPDFDSVERAHRREVDRVVGLADLMIWVVDPQKYADGALHDGYLRPLAPYAASMEVLLNQADLLDNGAVTACCRDLARLLEQDGLPALPVHPVSARTGAGLDDLRERLRGRVAARTAVVARLAADVGTSAATLAPGCAGAVAGELRAHDRQRLGDALEAAAGAPAIARAVEVAHRRRGALAAGWSPVRWVRRLRPDPLARLRLAERAGEEQAAAPSLPQSTLVQHAAVASAARTLAASAAGDAAHPWPGLIRAAATSQEAELPDALGTAVAGAELPQRRPRWWALAGLVQRALAVVSAAGLVWLAALAVLGLLRLDRAVPVPDVHGVALPTLLLVGGALAGLLLALLAGRVNALAGRRRARKARRSMRTRVEAVADELVVAPVQQELAARERLCAAVGRAQDDGAPRARRGRRREGDRPPAGNAPLLVGRGVRTD